MTAAEFAAWAAITELELRLLCGEFDDDRPTP